MRVADRCVAVRLAPDEWRAFVAEIGTYVDATKHIPWCECMRYRERHLCDCETR